MAAGFAVGGEPPAGRSQTAGGGWIGVVAGRSESVAEMGERHGRPAVGESLAGAALHAVIDAVDEGLLLLDEQQRPVLANRRFREFFGLGQFQELAEIRTAVADCMADPAAYLAAVADDAEAGSRVFELVRPERRLLRRRLAWVHDDLGERIGRLVAYRDITRDAEINRLKSDFVSNVSHELRTPMAAIKGFLTVVLDDEGELAAEQRRQFLSIALEQTDRLSRLIEDLLDISRIESGRQQRREATVELRRLLRDVAAAQRALVDQAGLTLTVGSVPEGTSVLADRDQLLQILLNLVSNAVKFTKPGGRVTVDCELSGEGCTLRVRDTGCGIAAEDLPHVFEKFYRSRLSSPLPPGTGLGLAIASELAAAHGGRLTVQSTPGEGSVFAVWLPPERIVEVG